MNLRAIKANMTELELKDGTLILFSYQTPVAYRMSDKYYRVTGTGKFWSVTTHPRRDAMKTKTICKCNPETMHTIPCPENPQPINQHTPGPWEYEVIAGHHGVNTFDGGRIQVDCERDARLIAAAPSMYELLGNIRLALEAVISGNCEDINHRQLLDDISKAMPESTPSEGTRS